MTKERAPVDVDEWAQDLSDAFLLCRDIGHTWHAVTASLTTEHTYTRVMQCPRCTTQRHQDLSLYGAILSSRYEYPDGYVAAPGMGRLTSGQRDHLRLESLHRLVRN